MSSNDGGRPHRHLPQDQQPDAQLPQGVQAQGGQQAPHQSWHSEPLRLGEQVHWPQGKPQDYPQAQQMPQQPVYGWNRQQQQPVLDANGPSSLRHLPPNPVPHHNAHMQIVVGPDGQRCAVPVGSGIHHQPIPMQHSAFYQQQQLNPSWTGAVGQLTSSEPQYLQQTPHLAPYHPPHYERMSTSNSAARQQSSSTASNLNWHQQQQSQSHQSMESVANQPVRTTNTVRLEESTSRQQHLKDSRPGQSSDPDIVFVKEGYFGEIARDSMPPGASRRDPRASQRPTFGGGDTVNDTCGTSRVGGQKYKGSEQPKAPRQKEMAPAPKKTHARRDSSREGTSQSASSNAPTPGLASTQPQDKRKYEEPSVVMIDSEDERLPKKPRKSVPKDLPLMDPPTNDASPAGSPEPPNRVITGKKSSEERQKERDDARRLITDYSNNAQLIRKHLLSNPCTTIKCLTPLEVRIMEYVYKETQKTPKINWFTTRREKEARKILLQRKKHHQNLRDKHSEAVVLYLRSLAANLDDTIVQDVFALTSFPEGLAHLEEDYLFVVFKKTRKPTIPKDDNGLQILRTVNSQGLGPTQAQNDEEDLS